MEIVSMRSEKADKPGYWWYYATLSDGSIYKSLEHAACAEGWSSSDLRENTSYVVEHWERVN